MTFSATPSVTVLNAMQTAMDNGKDAQGVYAALYAALTQEKAILDKTRVVYQLYEYYPDCVGGSGKTYYIDSTKIDDNFKTTTCYGIVKPILDAVLQGTTEITSDYGHAFGNLHPATLQYLEPEDKADAVCVNVKLVPQTDEYVNIIFVRSDLLPGDNKLPLIHKIRNLTSMSIQDTANFVQGQNTMLLRDVELKKAREIQAKLESCGAFIELQASYSGQ
jgi:ribosomal protein L7/L12